MEVFYAGLCHLRNFLAVLWILSFIWLHFAGRKLYCHLNSLPFIVHVDLLVKMVRRIFLYMALLPPYSPINLLLLFYWFVSYRDKKRHKWELIFHRIRFRFIEKAVLRKEGINGLIQLFEKIVSNVSEYLNSLEPGSTRYNLTANLYIKCQRRLEKMKRGENFGHFPIPE